MMLFDFFLICAISEQVPYRRTFHTDCHICQVLQGAHTPRCIMCIHKGEMQRFKLSWGACLQLGLPEKSAEQWGSGHTAYLSSQNKMSNLASFSLSLSLPRKLQETQMSTTSKLEEAEHKLQTLQTGSMLSSLFEDTCGRWK